MKKRILIVMALQVLVLSGMVAAKQYTLNTGAVILLETQPVDPRSLFRGDYVRLSYTINELALGALAGDDEFVKHDDVYVVLEKNGDYHQPVSVHREMPRLDQPDTPVIKGSVQRTQRTRWNRETQQNENGRFVGVKYGIENYFVPEGTGRELELRWNDAPDKRVDIRVAVDRAGKSGIKAVLVNGEERYVETLF